MVGAFESVFEQGRGRGGEAAPARMAA
jgi:hypothetical protein